MSDPIATQLIVSINSGSSLVVKEEVIRAMGIDPGSVASTTDSEGNITSLTADIALANLSAVTLSILNIAGVTGISTPDIDSAGPITFYNLSDVINWVLSSDLFIQFTGGLDGLNGVFTPNTYAGPKEGTAVGLAITNGSGITDLLNGTTTVSLAASGGTAPKINGHSSPVTVHFTEGKATVTISDTASGTVTLALSSPTHPSATLVCDSASVALA